MGITALDWTLAAAFSLILISLTMLLAARKRGNAGGKAGEGGELALFCQGLVPAAERLSESCLITNLDGRILYSSNRACRLLGYKRREVHGRLLEALAESPSTLAAMWNFSRLLRDQTSETQLRFRTRSGEMLNLAVQISILDRRSPGLVLVTLSRSDGEEDTGDSGFQLEALLKECPAAIFTSDSSGRMMFLNRRCCEIYGLDETDLLGFGWVRAVHPDDVAFVQTLWEDAVREQREFAATYRILSTQGERRVEVIAHPSMTGSSKPILYAGTMTDHGLCRRGSRTGRILETA